MTRHEIGDESSAVWSNCWWPASRFDRMPECLAILFKYVLANWQTKSTTCTIAILLLSTSIVQWWMSLFSVHRVTLTFIDCSSSPWLCLSHCNCQSTLSSIIAHYDVNFWLLCTIRTFVVVRAITLKIASICGQLVRNNVSLVYFGHYGIGNRYCTLSALFVPLVVQSHLCCLHGFCHCLSLLN